MTATTLRDRLTGWAWAVQERWDRHVTMRDLHRRLDACRAAFEAACPPEWDTPEYRAESLRRIQRAVLGEHDRTESDP